MRGSCSVTMAIPVHRQLVHMTFEVPLQHPQKHFLPLTGSISRPGVGEVLHSAHVRYPVPLQYMQSLRSCSLKLFCSITKKALMAPTAPPVKEATMGSTMASCRGRCMDSMNSRYEVPPSPSLTSARGAMSPPKMRNDTTIALQ